MMTKREIAICAEIRGSRVCVCVYVYVCMGVCNTQDEALGTVSAM